MSAHCGTRKRSAPTASVLRSGLESRCFVHGGEHYVEALKDWSCAAASIRNPVDQSVIGAVGLSGLTGFFDISQCRLRVFAAAGEIQAALAQALNEEQIQFVDALIEQGLLRAKRTVSSSSIAQAGSCTETVSNVWCCLTEPRSIPELATALVELEGIPSPDATLQPPFRKASAVAEISGLRVEPAGELRGLALVLPKRTRNPPCCSTGAFTADCRSARAKSRSGNRLRYAESGHLEAIDLTRRVAHVNAPVLVQGGNGHRKRTFRPFDPCRICRR